MTRKEKLRKEAIEACNRRGHSMSRFEHTGSGACASCKTCNKHVSVTPGFSYEIIGEAVALDCGDK